MFVDVTLMKSHICPAHYKPFKGPFEVLHHTATDLIFGALVFGVVKIKAIGPLILYPGAKVHLQVADLI